MPSLHKTSELSLNLPDESFAEFQTNRLAFPMVGWINAREISESAVCAAASCMPLPHEPSSYYTKDQRTLYADRYGGVGVGYCGGSARCGTVGSIQIKGVGKNQLYGVMRNAPHDPWHSSGTLDICEAGREAIWSSICESALPFGAVPSLSIVFAGTRITSSCSTSGEQRSKRRVLLMRTPALRPGHFMRNIHFGSAQPPSQASFDDSKRTEMAIGCLASAFVEAFGVCASGVDSIQTINDGLIYMSRRYASQAAAGFAKRIFHGGFSCSNIALDGRYLDFGTMTTVSAYRRRSGAPEPAGPDIWTEHRLLLMSLCNLHLHVSRYLKHPDVSRLVSNTELASEFSKILNNRREIEFLKLTGIPESFVKKYPEMLRSSAYGCMQDVLSRGAKARFVWRGNDDESVMHLRPIAKTGKFDLNMILSKAASFSEPAKLRVMLSEELDDNALADRFFDAYWGLRSWYISAFPEEQRVWHNSCMARQALRLNADVSFLTREALDEQLAAFEDNTEGLGIFINETIKRGRSIMDDDSN